jgi:uncharacterized tellurite resistance protein B-like protein
MTLTDILNLFRQGKATAKSHIKNLIEIAAADGEFTVDEQDLLSSIASMNNISQKQLQEIKANPDSIRFEMPKDSREKFHQLYDLVQMMSIDKAIHVEELKLCELFASKFGYEKEHISELIESIKANIQNGNGYEDSMKRIGAYLRL